MKKIFFLVAMVVAIPTSAQLLRHNFDEQGDTFIQGIARAQFWARYTETNPGTVVQGEPVSNVFDLSVRRYRLGFFAQVQKKWLFYVLMGNNNLNQKTLRTADFRLLDLLAQYSFSEKLSIGVAKGTFPATTRYSNGFANGSMLSIDPAIYYLNTSGHYDDVGRRLGMYAKGQLGKLEYFISAQSPAFPSENDRTKFNYAKGSTVLLTSSYLKYEFWDNEASRLLTSGGAGTYLGTKRILNVGMGYEYMPKIREINTGTATTTCDYFNFGVDFFMDTPISDQNDAITAYLSFNTTDFGKGYVRNVGANSIFDKGTSFNEAGNAHPAIGTGNSVFLQFGYLLPKWEGTKVRVQPNIGWKYADYKALNAPVNVYTMGVNTYFNGQKSKLSLGYENRPVFCNVTKKPKSRLGTLILQYQIEL